MGALSNAIASHAKSVGVQIETNAKVKRILVKDGKTEGIELLNGTKIESNIVLSNATPHVTFIDLLPDDILPQEFLRKLFFKRYQFYNFLLIV